MSALGLRSLAAGIEPAHASATPTSNVSTCLFCRTPQSTVQNLSSGMLMDGESLIYGARLDTPFA